MTERRRTEHALQKAVEDLRAANAELDRFASVAAHDMGDPLFTISGFAELLLKTDPSAEEAKKFAGHILDSSVRLRGTLRRLLAYARAGAAPSVSGPVDLATVVAHVQEDLAASISDRGARVGVSVPGSAQLLADADDLRIVLQNLVSNAIKFSDTGAPEVTIDAARHGDDWCISVRDNGPGIAPEHQARIFRAFERAPGRVAGYGLGLAIAQRLVERHGGRIGVQSAPSRGTRFWFTLRAAGNGGRVAAATVATVATELPGGSAEDETLSGR